MRNYLFKMKWGATVIRAFLLILIVGAGIFSSSSAQVKPVLPKPDHIVIVIEENHSYSEIINNFSDAPYINFLAQHGASFTQSFGGGTTAGGERIEHPSQPNYLFLFSGWAPDNIGDACDESTKFLTPNLGSQLISAGLTFGGYSENLPFDGFPGCSSGDYVRKHNPWVNWQGAAAYAVPEAANMRLESFPQEKFSKLPTVSIVVANLNNDMHTKFDSYWIKKADEWLEAKLKKYVEWAKTHNSLLIVTWDEDNYLGNNQIPTIFVGPMVSPGEYSKKISHYDVLRTIEDMYGLPYAGKSSNAIPISDVWVQQTVL